jgi:sec-independent protein translocase protein TatB
MEKKWAEQNARIMAEHPPVDLSDHEMRPLPSSSAESPAEPPPEAPADDEPQLPLR